MPNRIRNHVLEERSLAFLRDVFPDSWVIHSFSRDYGIDIQVEVFAENGDRTGIRFYGQVKATDKTEDEDLLRLHRRHFEYWAGHTDPVALFRYFDGTKQLRWRFLHDVDWLIKPGSDSLDVAGLLKTWDKNSSQAEIERYLHARRQALFEPLMPPYVITVEQLDERNNNAPLIAAKIGKEINSNSFRVLPKEVADGHFQVLIAPDKIASTYSGLPGFVFHHHAALTDAEEVERALLATFLCACRYERILFARSLATLLAPLLYRAAGDQLKQKLFDALIFALGLKSTVEIISPLLSEEDDSSLAWCIFATTCAASSWRYGEAHSWVTLLRQWLDNPPIPENAGAFSYNLGNSLSTQGQWTEACDAFTSALASDPDYGNRPYFWSEFGAAHFEAGNFDEASLCYEKALVLNGDAACRWRLGDSLFHAGQYAKANEQFRIAFPNVNARDRSYVELLMLICDDLRDVWGLESQAVSAIKEIDYEFLRSHASSTNDEELVSYLQPIMNKNAIDGCFNFNAGVFASRCGHHSIAGYRFLTCALRQRGDGEAWANSIVCALNAGNAYLASLSAKAAHFFLGEQFLPWILGMMPSAPQIPEQVIESWHALMAEIVEQLEHDRAANQSTSLLRFHSSSGTKEFHIRANSSS
jgi:tetratricopeptide (TPR) repeat protein